MKCILSFLLAGTYAAMAMPDLPLIPQPVNVQAREGKLLVGPQLIIRHDPQLAAEARLLADDLALRLGAKPDLATLEPTTGGRRGIRLELNRALDLPASGYDLDVQTQGIRITGKDAAGVFYGTRSLLQLMPPGLPIGASHVAVPAVKIRDYPRFAWRGTMLDCGRHLFPVEDIKRFIDALAFHKLNVFHWHLTEDQGWRIEIKKYPRLTEIGGFRPSLHPGRKGNFDDGVRYGGFYTQDQIKEVVAYAAARHITVMPEIELPGHAAAAIAAYPELGNNDIPGYNPKVQTQWGVHPYTFAPSEEVFSFLDDVFTEVCALFPSRFIHIGGDEAPKSQWDRSPRVAALKKAQNLKNSHEVQSYFIKRVEKILSAKGRRLIGWDEIREGGLSPEASVMSWRGETGGIASAKEGHDVVMATDSHLYFDHYQAPAVQELAKGLDYQCIGGHLPIEKVYSYNPIHTALNAQEAKHIMGVQAQLWSEHFPNFKRVEYNAFPRIAALAEVAWTPVEAKDYPQFIKRLDVIMRHYDAAGIRHGEVVRPALRKTKDGSQIKTSLTTHEAYWPELVYDGRPDTFFWSAQPLQAGDDLTLLLKAPLSAAAKVGCLTGFAHGQGDRLEQGVIESSLDSKTWQGIGTFSDGKAQGSAPIGTRALRIRCTAPQNNWLQIREITID